MDVIAICNALGNKTRFQIIKSLKNKSISTCCDKIEYFENGISVGDVVKLTGLAQSTVSQHLVVLEKAGLLYREKRDLWTCYFLNTEVIKEFLAELNSDLK
ncbi:ArsR/SmtB family transcription factor [Ruminiclostridium josui]|uniref:ArsR/SmtB family transcription factor n=1 Tax=Ruminiclostridium josui TaxID=1499 RepID=UPI0004649120|nr:metalloregulator ArsR/SmtB family transcription factor [Ruminiclostridium josui]